MDKENAYSEECMKLVHQIINIVLDDIMVNRYSCIQLKPDLPGWRDKYEIFYLGIIKESH
jgi:hypothetical protein